MFDWEGALDRRMQDKEYAAWERCRKAASRGEFCKYRALEHFWMAMRVLLTFALGAALVGGVFALLLSITLSVAIAIENPAWLPAVVIVWLAPFVGWWMYACRKAWSEKD